MAKINGIEVFANKYLNKDFVQADYDAALAKVVELSKNPNPMNRYEIAQVVAYIVDTVIKDRLNYLDAIADVKRVALGESIQFNVKLEGIKAYVQAVGSTVQRSQVINKQVTLTPVEVGARPVIHFAKLANGQQTMENVIEDAIVAIEDKIADYAESVMYTAYSALSTPFYASGSGFVTATFDPMLYAIARIGNPVITGDIQLLGKVLPSTVSDPMTDAYNRNGFIGSYKGANILRLDNKWTDVGMSTLELDRALLYVLPAGMPDLRPLKVGFEGGVRAMDQINIDDESWEISLKQNVAVAVLTDQKMMAVYEDEAL